MQGGAATFAPPASPRGQQQAHQASPSAKPPAGAPADAAGKGTRGGPYTGFASPAWLQTEVKKDVDDLRTHVDAYATKREQLTFDKERSALQAQITHVRRGKGVGVDRAVLLGYLVLRHTHVCMRVHTHTRVQLCMHVCAHTRTRAMHAGTGEGTLPLPMQARAMNAWVLTRQSACPTYNCCLLAAAATCSRLRNGNARHRASTCVCLHS